MSKKSDSKYDSDDEIAIRGEGKDYKSEGKSSRGDEKEDILDDNIENNNEPLDFPIFDAVSITIDPVEAPISDPLSLRITFTLDRDVIAAYWEIKVPHIPYYHIIYKH
jgi:hypothetical protein